MGKMVRLTTAQAIVRWLTAQRIAVDIDDTAGPVPGTGSDAPLFPGVFAIFGHGNVTCLGEALAEVEDELPTYRGQNEQGMTLAATAYAKAARRRRIMVATSSIGPGALNMVTAAGVAMANRLPLLLLAGDTFASRLPDPVLQQVEHFGDPSATVNDAFRAVTRWWDRITRPTQILSSLPGALAVMLDPGECGPAFLGLPQDVQGEADDFPVSFFEPVVHEIPRPRPDSRALDRAAAMLRAARQPLIVAGGGVRYSAAEAALAAFATAHRIPVAETVAGRASLPWSHPANVGPIGVTGSTSANALAAEADVVLAIGTRLQDFTTGSWTVFGRDDLRLIGLNAARFDAVKHRALAVVGDARVGLSELDARLAEWQAPPNWWERVAAEVAAWNRIVDEATTPGGHRVPGGDVADDEVAGPAGAAARGDATVPGGPPGAAPGSASGDGAAERRPSYAQVVGAVNRAFRPGATVLTAAGGFPGELNKTWRAPEVGGFDCEYGFSCMGYEIAGGWGAKLASPTGEVFVLVGDGSYLMLNSDLLSSVTTGAKLVVVLCDNGGYAVIRRLQVGQGGVAFNNMADDIRAVEPMAVDFVAHARSLGARAEEVTSVAELDAALARAREADRTTVILLRTDPDTWTGGDAWWEVGVPEVSTRPEVEAARKVLDEAKLTQRR
jgi:3D-(3,5/4)-trihydroxycyclohexane-1,2-dione acylhydrolase (decyclizing)